MNNIEQKRQRIELIAKIAALMLVGFFVAPFVFIAIKGIVGFIIASGIALTAIQFTPYFAMKIANWRLQAIKLEASKSPIETLQNDYNAQRVKLQEYEESIKTFGSEVGLFETKLVGFSKQYPDEVPKFQEQLSKMKQLLALRIQKFKDANKNLVSYDMEIRKASSLWDMSQAAAQMSKAAGVDNDEFIAKIQRETALDSVQKSLNSAFVDLDIALMNEDESPKTLESGSPKLVIDISGSTKQKVTA